MKGSFMEYIADVGSVSIGLCSPVGEITRALNFNNGIGDGSFDIETYTNPYFIIDNKPSDYEMAGFLNTKSLSDETFVSFIYDCLEYKPSMDSDKNKVLNDNRHYEIIDDIEKRYFSNDPYIGIYRTKSGDIELFPIQESVVLQEIAEQKDVIALGNPESDILNMDMVSLTDCTHAYTDAKNLVCFHRDNLEDEFEKIEFDIPEELKKEQDDFFVKTNSDWSIYPYPHIEGRELGEFKAVNYDNDNDYEEDDYDM